ncbi:MAG: FHA domain-containing protein [Deltaproteobacteria bacterium]|nr:FHA domain-containing protein [Deltaproteobacteria bacterium]
MNRRTKTTATAALAPSTNLTLLEPNAVRVVVINTVSKGSHLVFRDDEEVIVGASEEADLHVEDPTVSRRHVRITCYAGGARIEDLGSTNGTFYERSQVMQVAVPFGSTVMLGKAQLKILPHEKEVEANPSPVSSFGDLVGEELRMRQVFSLLADIAPTDATVVVEGETGTGKELVASALHSRSPRAKSPFVVFDCSSVPRELIESALFGHTKGAFTGATQTRQGAFRKAHGGTIFLDEIGELPIDLQPKLLRVLEGRTVQAVGGDSYERVDVRVIAATNRYLKDEVRQGNFREDLYYRLAVVRIALPPLRERVEDIPVLANVFLEKIAAEGASFASEDWDEVKKFPFPGNVRELRNLVERAVSFHRTTGPIPLAKWLPQEDDEHMSSSQIPVENATDVKNLTEVLSAAMALDSGLSFREAKAKVVEAFEQQYLSALLDETSGNISRAAALAKMDRKHLRDLLKKIGLWTGR